MYEIESFILRTDRKYLNYMPNSDIDVYRFDNLTNQWIQMTPSIGLSLSSVNYYAYIEDLACVIFNPALLNSEIKIRYEHSGVKNPFLIHESLDLIEKLKELSKNKISDTIFLLQSDDGDEYSLTVNSGSILYNGDMYIIPKHTINFRFLGLPSIIGQYYGYLLYVGSDTLLHNQYKPLKQVKPSIIRTNFVYKEDQFEQAKSELKQTAKKNLLNKNDPILEIAYVFVSIAKDTQDNYTAIYQVDYPMRHRKI